MVIVAKIILKSSTGVPLHERFTRFMKQRAPEDAPEPKIKRNLGSLKMDDLRSRRPVDKSDPGGRTKNQEFLKQLQERQADANGRRDRRDSRDRDSHRDSHRDRQRSRSPRDSRHRTSAKDRLGANPVSAKDRLGRRSDSGRDANSVRDRLGRISAKQRIDWSAAQNRDNGPVKDRIGRPNRIKSEDRTGKGFGRGNRDARTRSGDGGSFRRKSGPLDSNTLDKDMDDYMMKTRGGLDGQLDDYMNKRTTSTEINNADNSTEVKPDEDAPAESNQPVPPVEETV